MNILITGTSTGIGEATAELFLNNGHTVAGIDIDGTYRASWITTNGRYTHYTCDISDPDSLPDLAFQPDVIINNAGVQDAARDIDVNLKGTIYVCEKYVSPSIKSIVNVASTSAHNGAEFPTYAASKGGMLSYTKHLAMQVAKYGATCNSISPGGVYTDMNKHIMENEALMNQCLDETLLKRWASAEEIAHWIYFISTVNRSMTGQDIIIDNGELSNFNFIW